MDTLLRLSVLLPPSWRPPRNFTPARRRTSSYPQTVGGCLPWVRIASHISCRVSTRCLLSSGASQSPTRRALAVLLSSGNSEVEEQSRRSAANSMILCLPAKAPIKQAYYPPCSSLRYPTLSDSTVARPPSPVFNSAGATSFVGLCVIQEAG